MPKSNTMLSQTAYQYLLDLIMNQELLPGDRVPETSVAEKFNISRTPVRDAIQQLANEGLLEIFPNRFVQVKEYTPEDVSSIGTVRLSLDTMSVKLASLFGSRADFLKLVDIARECEEAYHAGDLARKRDLDYRFHMGITEITGNELLIKFQKELYLRVQYLMLCYPNKSISEEKQLKHHFEIADALLQNDAQQAEKLIVEHLAAYYNLQNKYPGDFFTK